MVLSDFLKRLFSTSSCCSSSMSSSQKSSLSAVKCGICVRVRKGKPPWSPNCNVTPPEGMSQRRPHGIPHCLFRLQQHRHIRPRPPLCDYFPSSSSLSSPSSRHFVAHRAGDYQCALPLRRMQQLGYVPGMLLSGSREQPSPAAQENSRLHCARQPQQLSAL